MVPELFVRSSPAAATAVHADVRTDNHQRSHPAAQRQVAEEETFDATARADILLQVPQLANHIIYKGGLGRLDAWHLPGGPVGPAARWAATSNDEGGSGTEEGAHCRDP